MLTEDPGVAEETREAWWGAYNDTKWYVIEPMAFWKAAFDGCTALLLLVLAFYIPFSIAFLDVGDFIWFDWYQLVWFSVDILLSFCSPYENEEGWVTNPKWIAAEYFQCFFWVDTISTFPAVLVLGASSGASPLTKLLKMPRLIKALRVLKMTKLTRAYKLDEVISQLATAPPCASQRRDLCGNQPVCRVRTKSSVMTRPCWHRRAMRNGIATPSSRRRVDGVEGREDSARTCRKILISTQAATLVILGMLGLVVNPLRVHLVLPGRRRWPVAGGGRGGAQLHVDAGPRAPSPPGQLVPYASPACTGQ